MKIKFKYCAIFIVSLSVFVPLSCADNLLDQTNPNQVSTGTFWRNADDANKAVNGMFHPITGTYFWGRIIHVGAFLRDDFFNPIGTGPNTAMSVFLGTPSGRWATEPFQEAYKSIFRANLILENVNEVNVPDKATRDGILGQAYFMRAFVYWHMVNMYGNVPAGQQGGIPLVIKTPDPTNEADLFPVQASAKAVWDQIILDLQKAETLLPDSWDATNLGRPTNGAATALKGKSYLYRSGLLGVNEYDLAETAFKKVVNSARYDLLPSNKFQENFTQVNENNIESVFELQFQPIGNGNFVWGSDIPRAGTQGNFVIEYAPPSQTPDEGNFVNPWVRKLFEANGETVRRNATIAYDYPGCVVNDNKPFKTQMSTEIALAASKATLPNNAGLEAIVGVKYSGLELPLGATGFLGDNYGPNWRVIRYSDVLLMLAESLNEQNKPSEALPLINKVRQRAQVTLLPLTLDKTATKQAIIDERVLELSSEGHRFFDLVRWGLAEKYLGKNSAHSGPHPKSINQGFFVKGKHELVWIPETEIFSNPKMKQNPGY